MYCSQAYIRTSKHDEAAIALQGIVVFVSNRLMPNVGVRRCVLRYSLLPPSGYLPSATSCGLGCSSDWGGGGGDEGRNGEHGRDFVGSKLIEQRRWDDEFVDQSLCVHQLCDEGSRCYRKMIGF